MLLKLTGGHFWTTMFSGGAPMEHPLNRSTRKPGIKSATKSEITVDNELVGGTTSNLEGGSRSKSARKLDRETMSNLPSSPGSRSAGQPSRREQKKRATRARLVESSLALFSERGFDDVTVDEITRRAGVAKGTFFNYFRSKVDVLLQVGAVQEEWMVAEIARLEAHQQTSVAETVTELMVAAASRLPLSRPLLRAMYQATLQAPEESEVQVQHFAHVGMALVPICKRGQESGELTKSLSVYEIVALIMQTYSGALLTWALTSAEQNLGTLVRRTFYTLFHGLKARGDLDSPSRE